MAIEQTGQVIVTRAVPIGLFCPHGGNQHAVQPKGGNRHADEIKWYLERRDQKNWLACHSPADRAGSQAEQDHRSDERRGGTGCDSKCTYRWSPTNEKKQKTQ